jgi:hypothetical protein
MSDDQTTIRVGDWVRYPAWDVGYAAQVLAVLERPAGTCLMVGAERIDSQLMGGIFLQAHVEKIDPKVGIQRDQEAQPGKEDQLNDLLYEATEAAKQVALNAPASHEASWASGFLAGLRRAHGIAFGGGDDG